MSPNTLSTGSTEATDHFLGFIQEQMGWKKSVQIGIKGEQGGVYFIKLSSHLLHLTLYFHFAGGEKKKKAGK